MGGASDYIERPGYRYSVQYDLPPLASATEARIFEALLEQASREDASYPWPLDQRSLAAGAPVVDGSNPVGGTIALRGLIPGFQFRIGQPFAIVMADGTRFIHKAKVATAADALGEATVPVFPLTRDVFPDGTTVEVERPRIGGILSWEGSTQGAFGKRPFSITITERR